jgi:hypothetical protein
MLYGDSMILTDGRYSFPAGDYGRSIPFQLYDQDNAKFVATGYTPYIKLYRENGSEALTEISPSWTAQATGAGTFAFTSTNAPNNGLSAFLYTDVYLNQYRRDRRLFLECQLEKSGTIRSFPCLQPIAITSGAVGPRTV